MKMKLSTVELVILGLSTILQLVCLVAPGWWIQTSKDSGYTTYAAIFYRIDCEKSHCETMSWRAYIDKSDSGKKVYIVIFIHMSSSMYYQIRVLS